MPIYEYSCQKCGAHTEVMQKITDKPLKRCKSCGGKLEKEWSMTSFQLKGSGWYVTDYAAKKSGAGDKEPATKSEAATKTDSSAAESKAVSAPAETKAEPAAVAEETKSKKTSRPTATSNGSKKD